MANKPSPIIDEASIIAELLIKLIGFKPYVSSFLEISDLSLDQKVKLMKDPNFKKKILSEEPVSIGNPLLDEIITSFNKMFRLGEPANYEPDPESSVLSESKRLNLTPQEIAYDMLLEKEGRALIYHPLFNYEFGNLDHVETMLKHP